MSLANPIAGGKLFPGFNNPEKWMKRVIRKLQRKSSAYGQMIATNTADISNNAGFISSIAACGTDYINDPDYGLSCCFEDTNNIGQCLCNGTTIDDTSNPGSCCSANLKHPDHCLCSGTDMDDPNNPGNCCFKDLAIPGQCLCNAANYTDDPNKRCFNLDWKGDGVCDDENNHGGCDFDGGDCCGEDADTDLCTLCQCLEEEALMPNALGCCFEDSNNPGQCLCTGTEMDDPATPGSCCKDDVDNPGNCFVCEDSTTCNGNGTCIGNTGICECNGGFTGDHCDILTCSGKPICGGVGTCPEGSLVCDCGGASYVNAECSPPIESGEFLMVTCGSASPGTESEGKTTEVIDVLDPSKTCTTSIPDFPKWQKYMPRGGYLNGNLWICGGDQSTGDSDGDPRSKECYKADCSSLPCTWSHEADLGVGRAYSGSVVIKGTDPANDKMWFIGGHNINPPIGSQFYGRLDSSEFLHADGSISVGPNLPIKEQDHCAVQLINSDGTPGNVLYMGASHDPDRKKVWHYDISTDAITADHSTMLFEHSVSACTIFYSPKHEGRPVVYMGPGEFSNNQPEILDYEMTTTWEALPVMVGPPNDQWLPRAVPTPTMDGVYHIYDSVIYELKCTSSACAWTTIPDRFTTAFKRTRGFQAIYIPENLVSCS
jgi:hypothetical protein